MGEIRVGLQAGSAAKQAEEEAEARGKPRSLRIQAGTSARLAEEAKRLGQVPRRGGASFSLRAQGGQVLRTDLAPRTQAPVELSPAASLPALQQTSEVSALTSPYDVPSPPTSARAVLSRERTGRLKSFLQGLFPRRAP